MLGEADKLGHVVAESAGCGAAERHLDGRVRGEADDRVEARPERARQRLVVGLPPRAPPPQSTGPRAAWRRPAGCCWARRGGGGAVGRLDEVGAGGGGEAVAEPEEVNGCERVAARRERLAEARADVARGPKHAHAKRGRPRGAGNRLVRREELLAEASRVERRVPRHLAKPPGEALARGPAGGAGAACKSTLSIVRDPTELPGGAWA